MGTNSHRRAKDSDLRKVMYRAIKTDFEEYGINWYSNYPTFLRMVDKAMRRVMSRRRAK